LSPLWTEAWSVAGDWVQPTLQIAGTQIRGRGVAIEPKRRQGAALQDALKKNITHGERLR